VGDCFLTIGMFAILWTFGNIDYATVFSLAPFISENIITIIGICLLIGAMAKSSQVGLHVWLPMAITSMKKLQTIKEQYFFLNYLKAIVHKQYFATLTKKIINNEPSSKGISSNDLSPE
jgi:hypothetical protein